MIPYCIIIVISSFISFASCNTNTNEYGYFDVNLNYIKPCQGPKRKDCSINSVNIQNGTTITYDLVVKENITPTKGKIMASVKNKQMVRLQMNKPCQHVFIKPIINALFDTSDTCLILKGHYHFDMDMGEIFHKYYSGMFLYGNWTFKSIFYNDDCNFLCTVTEVNLYPKKEI